MNYCIRGVFGVLVVEDNILKNRYGGLKIEFKDKKVFH